MAKTKASKAWDTTVKQLVHLDPSAFVQWLLPNAQFVDERSIKLPSFTREVDVLHEVVYQGQRILLHIEFQTYNDKTMPDRLVMYNVVLTDIYTLPVVSCVVYLLPDGDVYPSPLERRLLGGESILTFHFRNLELRYIDAHDLINLDNTALLALIPLTRDGMDHATIETMFSALKRSEVNETQGNISEIEAIAFTLASYIFEQNRKSVDQEWLKRRYREMYEALENTSLYREVMQRVRKRGLQEGREEGLEQGRELGLEQGRIDSRRHSIRLLVQSRFPNLADLAQEAVTQVNELEQLDVILVSIGSASTEQDAQAILQRLKDTKTE